jgi:hypothetical protein
MCNLSIINKMIVKDIILLKDNIWYQPVRRRERWCGTFLVALTSSGKVFISLD